MDVSPFAAQSNKTAMMANSAIPGRSLAASPAPQLSSQLASQLSPLPASEAPAFTLDETVDTPLNAQTESPVGSEELREAFEDFVGQTFFAEMIKACRSSQQPSAYFHGGRAEEIFQGQLDQVLSEELSESSASKIADPMFELFMLKRQS